MIEITFHREGYDEGHAAVNVKVYSRLYPDDLEPFADRIEADLSDIVQNIWEDQCAYFWLQTAPEIARDHGFDDVVSEGRSGGWCVPVINGHGLTEGDLEEDRKLQRAFLAFKKNIDKAVDAAVRGLRISVIEELRLRELDFLADHSVAVRAIA